jgi:hypothetical protein
MGGFTGVLAHQGGWDELLLVATPIAIFVLLLRVANARAARLAPPDDPSDRLPRGGDGPHPDAGPTAGPSPRDEGPVDR